jgi:hypothetical protein
MSTTTKPKRAPRRKRGPDEVTRRVIENMPGRPATRTERPVSDAKAATRGNAGSKPKPTAKRAKAAAEATPKRKPAKAAKPKPPGKKALKYPDWLPDAVKRSRVISGRKINSKTGEPFGDMTLSYPGPKQHLHIRAAVKGMIEGPVTADAVLRASGVKSLAKLTAIADWSADKSEMKPMRGEFTKACDDNTGWSTGRYLAAALVAWIEELRAAEKAS